MKKFAAITVLAASSLLATSMAQADTLGLKAGVDYWNTHSSNESVKKDSTTYNPDYNSQFRPGFFVAVEHPIPLIPNFMLRYQDVDTDGNDGSTHINNDQRMYDAVLYYQAFDNPAFGIDYGMNLKYFDGTIQGIGNSRDYTKTMPTLYLAANVNIPMTGVELFGNTSNMRFDGTRITDTQVGISYDILPLAVTSIQVRAGYRYMKNRLKDADSMNIEQKTQGWFLGLGVHF
ncbi:MAG: hypothetical protein CENE_01996 [Candidatus Celerinatantimonas neptuna]|nr:MAG: hypothetical protein CENE_01996 [Candidatus Celerinatantimonas neptuna]